MIRFLMDDKDPRAQALRDAFVFKLIPTLNPDGVSRGHYRCDSQGLNLNRFYNTPLPDKYPSVYASRCLTSYHAAKGALGHYERSPVSPWSAGVPCPSLHASACTACLNFSSK